MTDLLQALDLVVNAIFKQFTRKIRTKMIIKAFEEHKLDVMQMKIILDNLNVENLQSKKRSITIISF